MRISRIFVPVIFEAGQALEVEGETSHYLKTVLRLRKGWKLILFDGQGQECPATVESFGRDSTVLRLESPSSINRESSLEVRLAIGISRGERMDLAIQKAVELGVHHISPLLTEFCVVRLDEEKRDVRHTHWQRVIRSAMEQCGRNLMPKIDPPCHLGDWLETREPFGQEFVLDPEANSGLYQVHETPQQMTLLIGPEGGLSEQEKNSALELGFQSLRLGPRVLRTETAVIAALSAVQALWGDLGGRAD
jgi:16S rRNA (uracil1498-N3)-methyltransferase